MCDLELILWPWNSINLKSKLSSSFNVAHILYLKKIEKVNALDFQRRELFPQHVVKDLFLGQIIHHENYSCTLLASDK